MNTLIQIALAGTAKVSQDAALTETPLDELLANLPEPERERALLLRAAAEATYTVAGYQATPGSTLPDPAPMERQKVCPSSIADLIGDLLSGKHPGLLLEALGLLAAADMRLPPALLPLALRSNVAEKRAALRPVLGERGRWLSRFNPGWSWATEAELTAGQIPSDIETLWQEGSHAQRLSILRRVHAEDAALARTWIEAAWREEKADARNDMLEALANTVSLDDEPLLEQALDDRAQTVRAHAAKLLAAMPGSGLTNRIRDRAESLLSYTPPAPVGRLRALVRSVLPAPDDPGTLMITLPAALDKAWQRDGISLKQPQGFGQQSWWLTQTLALVPPAHWEARFGAPPARLIAAAASDDAGLAVIEGWSRAALLHRSQEWALALWQFWLKTKPRELTYLHVRGEMLQSLVTVLPRQEAWNLAANVLRDKSETGEVGALVVRAQPAPWETQFGNLYLDTMSVQTEHLGYVWQETFASAAQALPPACFDRALSLFTPAAGQAANWYLRPFLATIELRRRLYEEINP